MNTFESNKKLLKITYAGLMAALCYVGYAIFPAINAAGTKIHIGNAFVVLGSLLLGGPYGGAAGAVGLTLADLLGGYAEFFNRNDRLTPLVNVHGNHEYSGEENCNQSSYHSHSCREYCVVVFSFFVGKAEEGGFHSEGKDDKHECHECIQVCNNTISTVCRSNHMCI